MLGLAQIELGRKNFIKSNLTRKKSNLNIKNDYLLKGWIWLWKKNLIWILKMIIYSKGRVGLDLG